MPGALLHVGTTVACAHPGGQATPSAPPPNPRVLVSGQPIVTHTTLYKVDVCPFGPPNGPCVPARWMEDTCAQRVFASGERVVLVGSQSLCTPTGRPLTPTVTQTRVVGV